MSTFKKLLALTLALAMVLSVSAFAGYSADTYKDSASIDEDCEDSVELMYALDIMTGDNLGNFNPTAPIKRAEIAKMIYVILNYGDDDEAVNYKGGKFFTDVPADAWYEGYVNYLATTKLVQGRGDGTFGPEDYITCAEAAKMLLTAIGYSAADRGYTGANWAQNVLADAAIVGLLDGYQYNTNTYAPRQWVAVMFDNALTEALTYNKMAPVITGGLLTSITGNQYDVITMGEKYYGLKEVTGVAIATPNAYIDGTGKADDYAVLFDDGDKVWEIRGSGLEAADLGQEYRVIYKKSSSSSYDGTAYSVSSLSDVAEARTLDMEVDVKYGTSSNKAANKYEFTIGEMVATFEDYEINVLKTGTAYTNSAVAFTKVDVDDLRAIIESPARDNDSWKAIDTDCDGKIDYFFVTEYDYAYVTDADNHNKYGDYIVAEDLNTNTTVKYNGESRLYIEDCVISEDTIEEKNIVKYTWDIDEEMFQMEVLPLEEEVTYDSRDTKKAVYTLGGEDYMIADEAELDLATAVLKAGNLGESIDYVADGDLIVWAALTDSNYTDIADINAQLVLVLDVYDEYSGGTIRNQAAIQYMTIDGETHIAAYQNKQNSSNAKVGVWFDEIRFLADAQWANGVLNRDNDRDDLSYTMENRLFILHEGTQGRVYLEQLSNEGDDPNEQLSASTSLLDAYRVYGAGYAAAKLDSTGSTVKLNDNKLAAEHPFFYGYYNSYGEAVYGVVTPEELNKGTDTSAYAQVLTLDNDRATRTSVVAGYIFTRNMIDDTDDGYLFVDEILAQTDSDYERLAVTFADGEDTTATIDAWKINGNLVEGYLYSYNYNIVDDDYELTLVDVDDTDDEIVDMDDYIIINGGAQADLELGDDVDLIAVVTIEMTRDQNADQADHNDFDAYKYVNVEHKFVAPADLELADIVDNEWVAGNLQYSDFVYDASEDLLYVITWVCMDQYTGANLNDSPLALWQAQDEAAAAAAALKAAKEAKITEWNTWLDAEGAEESWSADSIAAAKAAVAAEINKMTSVAAVEAETAKAAYLDYAGTIWNDIAKPAIGKAVTDATATEHKGYANTKAGEYMTAIKAALAAKPIEYGTEKSIAGWVETAINGRVKTLSGTVDPDPYTMAEFTLTVVAPTSAVIGDGQTPVDVQVTVTNTYAGVTSDAVTETITVLFTR